MQMKSQMLDFAKHPDAMDLIPGHALKLVTIDLILSMTGSLGRFARSKVRTMP